MSHTWRLSRRRKTLERIFSSDIFENLWSRYIKTGFRGQTVTDLHDYNDWNNFRKAEYDSLILSILDGNYTPSQPFVLTSEKKFGVLRRISIPSIRDAFFLQALVEHLLPVVLQFQPSKNSFFSRSHRAPDTSFKVETQGDYPWFVSWKRFTARRKNIISAHPFIATTDLTNFFDSIQLDQLRNIISSFRPKKVRPEAEVVLDLMIETLNQMNWVPDYLPRRHVGLVQLNFDAPRLLAHAYLFEIDDYMVQNCRDLYIRWVDDITFPGKNREELANSLSEIDSILQARGCRLNLGKTTVLTAREAYRYFRFKENADLDRIEALPTLKKSDFAWLTASINDLKKDGYGHWDKVVKRIIGILSKHKEPVPIPTMRSLLTENPGLRSTAFRNLTSSGFGKRRFQVIVKFLHSKQNRCGLSAFEAWATLCKWQNIPADCVISLLRDSDRYMADRNRKIAAPYHFGRLRFLLIYGTGLEVLKECEVILVKYGHEEFAIRQAAAAIAYFPNRSAEYIKLRRILEQKFLVSTASVLRNLDFIAEYGLRNSKIRGYVTPSQLGVSGYSLERFIIARFCARSPISTASDISRIGESIKKYCDNKEILANWDAEFR